MGIILNVRYLEIVNFVPACFFLDLTGEDGDPRGKWPWQSDYAGNLPERMQLTEPEARPEPEPGDGSAPASRIARPGSERPLPR